ncbi:MAG TPA: ABC transporter permease subunit [Verrucomicrobiae bacterium]|nr:ABC transporter permease subunit [Verrucomicrobiae bacterium]
MKRLRFGPILSRRPPFTAGDSLILLGLAALLYAGVRLAFAAPRSIAGPQISTSPAALPWYALLSIGRMTVAYFLSLTFSLAYGYAAARHRGAKKVLLPLLDVLQSVPILSFLPVVLLGLSAVVPVKLASEMAAIVLIFTSQAWNMTFSFYQSMTTQPGDLKEAASVFRFDPWLRLKTLELPFAAMGLIWNSMMSWAGGWFFLMAAEIYNVGARDFRLPGLGSYLQTAAASGDKQALLVGILTLVLIIALLDQLVWRPLLAWADKFKVEMTEGDDRPTSWVLDVLSRSYLVRTLTERYWDPFAERLDARFRRRAAGRPYTVEREEAAPLSRTALVVLVVLALGAGYGGWKAVVMLRSLPAADWAALGLGLLATFARVVVALVIALLWTVPLGVLIGTRRNVAAVLQPLVQIVASIPATAIFPMIVVALLQVRGGVNIAAVLLMLMGTQWYLLFNVIAGASAIPVDLRYTTDLLRVSTWDRWRVLILPALFPYIITGAVTASGGAWNASIVAEHVTYGGEVFTTPGVGAVIAAATDKGNYPLLLAGTLALVLSVVLINRLFWRRLYHLAEVRYRLD